MDSAKDGLLASALRDNQGNLASLTLVPLLPLAGPSIRVNSAAEYSISADMERRVYRVTPRMQVVANPKLQDIFAPLVAMA